jgi:alanine dehydrogenase
MQLKIGIVREGKTPPDRRAAFTPKQCKQICELYPQVQVIVQSSTTRIFKDEAYRKLGIPVQDTVNNCDILFGIKEVPVKDLIAGKTYLFFSHTIKKQELNKKLLQVILDKNIRLIDYEALVDANGGRIIGFGRFAGLVGAYNGMRAWAFRNKLKPLKPVYTLDGLDEMKAEAAKFDLPPIKIAFTGTGRVAKGVKELLDYMGVKEVSVATYLAKKHFKNPVYVQLEPYAYTIHKENKLFDYNHFISFPTEYTSNFKRFCNTTDLFISSAFWDPRAPKLFTNNDMLAPDFRIKILADITCDINGGIPSTLKHSTITEPFYSYNPKKQLVEKAFVNPESITVMAVDNLPNELAKDASEYFGQCLIDRVLPNLLGTNGNYLINQATITENGALTESFKYLHDWVNR